MNQRSFLDSNGKEIVYNGEPVTWRISAYAVIQDGGKLLLKRGYNEAMWDFPGGGVEVGESLSQATIRETIEEIGARVKLGKLITHMEGWFYLKEKETFHHTLRYFYRAEPLEPIGQPTDPKIKEIKWWPINQINKNTFQDAVTHAVKHI